MSDPLPNRPAPSNTVLLWLSETALLLVCYILAAYFLYPDNLEFQLLYDNGLVQILLAVLVIQVGLWVQMLYNAPQASSRMFLLMGLLRVLGSAFLFQVLWYYVDPSLLVPRLVMLYGSLLVLLALPLWRAAFAALQDRATANWRLVLIGDDCPTFRELIAQGSAPGVARFTIAGILKTESTQTREATLQQLEDLVSLHQPTHIVIAGNPPYARECLELQWSGLQVLEATEFYESVFRCVLAESVQPADLLFSDTFHPPVAAGYSPVVACLTGLLVLPGALLLALAVRLSGGGPVVVRSRRRGLAGTTFDLYRFRVLSTGLGRWMQRWGMHRLPELVNVLRGELAFIGPRPLPPGIAEALEQQIPLYRHRSTVRPGIWGWAQLNLSSRVPQDPVTEIEYDLYYIKHRAAHLKAYILGHCFQAQ